MSDAIQAVFFLLLIFGGWIFLSVQSRNKKRQKLTEDYVKVHGSICAKCEKNVPVLHRRFYKTFTLLVLLFRKKFEGVICDECTREIGNSYTLFTAFLGWPGVFIVLSVMDIIENIIEMGVQREKYPVQIKEKRESLSTGEETKIIEDSTGSKMYCSNCDKEQNIEIIRGDKFCIVCGHTLFKTTTSHHTEKPIKPGPSVITRDGNITSCPNCGKPLPATQINKMKNNQNLTDWYREGYCSFACFKKPVG